MVLPANSEPRRSTTYAFHPRSEGRGFETLRDRNLLESVGSAAFVTSLFTFVPTAANVQYYIDIVREKYDLRRMISFGTEIVRKANEGRDLSEILAFAESELPRLYFLRERRIRFFAPSLRLRGRRPQSESAQRTTRTPQRISRNQKSSSKWPKSRLQRITKVVAKKEMDACDA
jgi:hypothetical protein